MKINCIIIEDEPLALEQIEKFVKTEYRLEKILFNHDFLIELRAKGKQPVPNNVYTK